jgi:hypothetical protein
MGAAIGSPIDDVKQARINELIQEVVQTFVTQFAIKYALLVVDDVKNDADPKGDWSDELKLQEAPAPSTSIHEGILKKRGDASKNWKSRHFTFNNEADNWSIEYCEGDKKGGKKKGEIFCAGYHCAKCTQTEMLEETPFGFKLEPYSSRRRTWYFQAKDEDDRDAFMKAFNTACYKSQPPSDDNAIIAEAFSQALQATRWEYCVWGWSYGWGSEAERLSDFVCDIVDREVVSDALHSMPESVVKKQVVSMVIGAVAAAVRTAITPAWTAAREGAVAAMPKVKQSCETVLGPLLENEQKLKSSIVKSIGAVTSPFLSEQGGKLLTPFMNVATRALSKCFTEAVKGFQEEITKKDAENAFGAESENVDAVMDKIDRTIDYSFGEPFGKAYNECWKMYAEDMGSVAELFASLGGFSLYSVYNICMDNLKNLARRSSYTLRVTMKEGMASTAAIAQTMTAMVHDCKVYIKQTMMMLFDGMLGSMISEMILVPCKILIAPVQEAIDSLPVPGLSELFNLVKLLEDSVADIVKNAFDALLSGGLAGVNTSIDSTGLELGIAALSV